MKALKILTAFIILLLIVAGGISYWLYRSLTMEIAHDKSEKYIKVEKGQSPGAILAGLEKEGVIYSSTAASVYLRIARDAGKLQAGEYLFKSPISTVEVIGLLEKGSERTKRLTIPEGWTRFEIAKRVAANFPAEPPMDEKAVLYLMNDTSLISDIDPMAQNLEGYLYPTTYDFSLDASPQDAIKRMVEQFRETWKPEWSNRSRALGMTNRQIVTIASLIENESKFESERRIVSSVIYNRLNRGMALGIDATNVYIAKMLGRWDGVINKSDIEINHPYNTRKISGLPPGPISSASESSLEAALNPSSTNYLYYVLDVDKNDGSHSFYESAAEFERGKAKYQRWLAGQRSK
ncbi:MAG: endolytic transglycosylase MltG [Acidobacteriota bacterium]|nr:endolytic transglycosylase MltG [Acidobacteriota bacterium]MDH3528533.1 endolytic transglycosylase MltG [Acidobacteriota bacterium]